MEIFSVHSKKSGPPKIGGPVPPNSSNMPKAGPDRDVLIVPLLYWKKIESHLET